MMTVKEISDLTGISARTLHYYDEIGLFTPTDKSEAGYRLYDDKALEILQQILFFREFDIPLKEIKSIMEHPDFNKTQILQMQRKMLTAKKERLERLIVSIDEMVKGENKMDFAVFNKNEMEEMYHALAANMTDAQKEIFIRKYGSMDQWKNHFLEKAAGEEVQKNFQKVVEWYGGKEQAFKTAVNPESSEIQQAYQKRLHSIMQKIAGHKGEDIRSFEVRSLVGEYDFVTKQMFQLPDASEMILELAKTYQTSAQIQAAQDSVYGEGATAYIGKAVEAFYKR